MTRNISWRLINSIVPQKLTISGLWYENCETSSPRQSPVTGLGWSRGKWFKVRLTHGRSAHSFILPCGYIRKMLKYNLASCLDEESPAQKSTKGTQRTWPNEVEGWSEYIWHGRHGRNREQGQKVSRRWRITLQGARKQSKERRWHRLCAFRNGDLII